MTEGDQSIEFGDETVDPSILHLSPAERADRGIDDEAVRDAFLAVCRHGDAEQRDLSGVELPPIDLDRRTVAADDRHPVDLRDATIEGLSARFADLRLPFQLDGATVGSLDLDEATVVEDLTAADATIEGPLDAFETEFRGDVSLAGATVEGPVGMDEAVFANDVAVDDATFADDVRIRAARFHGNSNLLEDNASFTDATFEGDLDVRQTDFGFTHFERITVAGEATFEEAAVEGDVAFDGATFRALADFDEGRFDGDASFADVAFEGPATFRGARFAGGERALEADATFAGATFAGDATFEQALFRYVSFAGARFEEVADFQAARFTDDAAFGEVQFADHADFDEVRFEADADFTGAHFAAACDFRGAEFQGGDNFLEDAATFEGTRFDDDAAFQHAEMRSANFRDTAFGGAIDFSDATFTDRIEVEATEVDDDVFVDFTRASIPSGTITQPADAWVRYDLTLASLGDVELAAASDADYRRLLDYFRVCRTEFDEFDGHTFDFSGHRDYLDRNAWALHEFHEPDGREMQYALEMTPGVIEETYLRAKQAAVTDGDMKVAGEFRVKRQQYSRRKNLEVVRDGSTAPWTRLKNLGRAAENYFLGVTCGHGMRPLRIGAAFVVAPLLFVPLYAFEFPVIGSFFATSAADGNRIGSLAELLSGQGAHVLLENARFSYISYTTIGYGFLGPEGLGAEILAASEAYLGVVLSALLVYALVKRSEL